MFTFDRNARPSPQRAVGTPPISPLRTRLVTSGSAGERAARQIPESWRRFLEPRLPASAAAGERFLPAASSADVKAGASLPAAPALHRLDRFSIMPPPSSPSPAARASARTLASGVPASAIVVADPRPSEARFRATTAQARFSPLHVGTGGFRPIVRIARGGVVDEALDGLGANAATLDGRVLAHSERATPGTLAHEAVHVAQQRAGAAGAPSAPRSQLEAEAVSGKPGVYGASPASILCEPATIHPSNPSQNLRVYRDTLAGPDFNDLIDSLAAGTVVDVPDRNRTVAHAGREYVAVTFSARGRPRRGWMVLSALDFGSSTAARDAGTAPDGGTAQRDAGTASDAGTTRGDAGPPAVAPPARPPLVTPTNPPVTVFTNTDAVRLHSSPAMTEDHVTMIRDSHTALMQMGESRDFLWVRHDGRDGYVARSLVDTRTDEASVLENLAWSIGRTETDSEYGDVSDDSDLANLGIGSWTQGRLVALLDDYAARATRAGLRTPFMAAFGGEPRFTSLRTQLEHVPPRGRRAAWAARVVPPLRTAMASVMRDQRLAAAVREADDEQLRVDVGGMLQEIADLNPPYPFLHGMTRGPNEGAAWGTGPGYGDPRGTGRLSRFGSISELAAIILINTGHQSGHPGRGVQAAYSRALRRLGRTPPSNERRLLHEIIEGTIAASDAGQVGVRNRYERLMRRFEGSGRLLNLPPGRTQIPAPLFRTPF